MKRNKIAAGALALALGLSAVAPSFAADETISKEFTEEYKNAKKDYVEAWNAVRKAEANLENAKANEAAAKAAYDKVLAQIKALEEKYDDEGELAKALERAIEEKKAAIKKYEGIDASKAPNYDYLTEKYLDKLYYYIDENLEDEEKEAQAEALKDIIAMNDKIAKLEADKLDEGKLAELRAELARRLGDWNEAVNKRQEAEKALKEAKEDYDDARQALIDEGMKVDIINKAEKAGDINIVIKAEKPSKPADKDEITPETRAKLEKAIEDAKHQIAAVEILKKTTPKTIKDVVGKLDKLVKDAEATIKMSEELLGKKAALNLVSTAYAEEEEKSAEEKAKELTEKLNQKTKEIEDTLKENEANQPEEGEKDPEVKPEDDKKDDEKEDDKKDDDKKEDKKDENKKEEKTTTTTKVVKKAGNNAKTGIAGVAGVAGVLAAASVAYAASKKNN